jgi:hypothetical protein
MPGTPVGVYFYYNTSSVTGKKILNVTWNYTIESVTNGVNCYIWNLEISNNSQSVATLLSDMRNGTNFVYNSNFCTTNGSFKMISLGANATQTSIFNSSSGWAGFGIPNMTGTGTPPTPTSYFDMSENTSYAPVLIITYEDTGSGLINNSVGAVPFYQNTTNPINVSLNKSQSVVVNWYVNATGRINSSYLISAYANITLNNSVNDITESFNITIIQSQVDTTKPYFTFIPANQTLELNVTGLNVNFTGTDLVDFGAYDINDKVNFSINSTGWVKNLTKLLRQDYILNISINDTSGNVNYTLFNVSVQDTRKPYFTLIPANATLEYKTTGLNVDFNAYDDGVGFASYKIDDIVNFTINSTGGLINATNLNLGTYIKNVSINDTQSLVNYTLYKVFVNDTTPPVITTINNISIYTNQSVLGDYSATDLDTITWDLNSTVKFSINTTGDIINSSSLSAGVYYLIVYVNDTSNNRVESNINITVLNQLDTTPPTFLNISNITHYTNQSVGIDFNATDETGFSNWTVNDTNFAINSSGYFKNLTTLSVGIRYLNITINDTSNNLNSTIINVTTLNMVHIFPNITIVTPTNSTNTTDTGLDVNYTVADDLSVSACWYSNNSELTNTTITCGVNITGATWLEGLNNLTFYVNDTNNNINSTKVSFRVDTISPNLTIISPTNNSNSSNNNLYINYTRDDSGSGLKSCWYSNNSGLNNYSLTNCVNISGSWLEGFNNITIWINDSVGNINNSKVTFRIDTIKPYFVNASNQNIYTNESAFINISAKDDGVGFGSCVINDTTNFQINTTCGLTNKTTLTVKQYFINVTINDTVNNLNSTIVWVNVSAQLDNIPPNITITFPDNNSNLSYKNVAVLFTIADNIAISRCWYSNNSGLTNTSIYPSCSFVIDTPNWLEGINNLTIWINDTSGNENHSSVTFRVDTIKPYFNPLLTNQSVLTNQSLIYDINGFDDGVGFSNYSVNDTIRFSINSTGGLVNITTLSVANYSINITIKDLVNNWNSSIIVINVSSEIITDITSPTFTFIPSSQTLELNMTGLGVNFTATDETAFGSYTVNDTNFEINSTGWIKNITMLINKTYFINITINDTSNNLNSTIFKVDVNDTLKPYFNPLPTNQTIYTNQSIRYDTNAFDLGVAGISYAVNDTNFAINVTGGLNNITTLTIKNYTINISINDSQGNLNSTMMSVIVVNETAADTNPPTWSNLRNFTHTNGTAFSNSITATDSSGIGSYVLNDTNVFGINSATGLITNATNLSTIIIYYLNISVNDTAGNLNSGIFWINITEATTSTVTSTPRCRYKSFGYYNLRLPWFREVNCI